MSRPWPGDAINEGFLRPTRWRQLIHRHRRRRNGRDDALFDKGRDRARLKPSNAQPLAATDPAAGRAERDESRTNHSGEAPSLLRMQRRRRSLCEDPSAAHTAQDRTADLSFRRVRRIARDPESPVAETPTLDHAVLELIPNDVRTRQDGTGRVAPDNVVFKLGLLMGPWSGCASSWLYRRAWAYRLS